MKMNLLKSIIKNTNQPNFCQEDAIVMKIFGYPDQAEAKSRYQRKIQLFIKVDLKPTFKRHSISPLRSLINKINQIYIQTTVKVK